MSSLHATSAHSLSSSGLPNTPDFAALASALQETAQALLALSSANAPDKAEEAGVPAATEASTAASSPAAGEIASGRCGETRSFYFPPAVAHQEKELLRRYRANDFQGLLEEVHSLLLGQVKLMQSVHKDVRVKGYVISSLGKQLAHASALVLRMRNVYDRVMPVKK